MALCHVRNMSFSGMRRPMRVLLFRILVWKHRVETSKSETVARDQLLRVEGLDGAKDSGEYCTVVANQLGNGRPKSWLNDSLRQHGVVGCFLVP
ncbi:hypothetical protein VTI28DRAFT_332 [Corynascus sepedonium]